MNEAILIADDEPLARANVACPLARFGLPRRHS